MSDNNNSVLLSTFLNGKRKVKIIFHKELLVWDNDKPPLGKCATANRFTLIVKYYNGPILDQHSVPLENVISVQHEYLKGGHPSLQRQIDPNQFTIHYAEKTIEDKWLYKYLTLKHAESLQVASWVKTLQNHLSSK